MRYFTRFLGWWGAVSALTALGGACPCCGGGVCPRGMALFGVIGAFLSGVLRCKNQVPATATSESEPVFACHDFSSQK